MEEYTEFVSLKDLKLSVDYMLSDDWKERFIAEYAQLVTRIDNLLDVLWEDSEEEVPGPTGILSLQVDKMSEYRHILEIRAEIYGIDLDEEVRKLNEK